MKMKLRRKDILRLPLLILFSPIILIVVIWLFSALWLSMWIERLQPPKKLAIFLEWLLVDIIPWSKPL